MVLHFRLELAFAFRIDLPFRSLPASSFAAGLNLFYRGEFERFNVRHRHLIACFDSFQFTGIEMFKEVNVAVELFGDCVGSVTVREKFQFCLLGYLAR